MKSLTVRVSDEVYEACRQMAEKYGGTVEQYVLEFLVKYGPKPRRKLTEEETREAWKRLLQHAGKGRSGNPRSADNDSIDSDLALEYGSTHEGS